MSDAFDAGQTMILTRALLRATAQLLSASLVQAGSEAHAKVLLAEGIVTAADNGERDEDKLVASALAHHAASRRF